MAVLLTPTPQSQDAGRKQSPSGYAIRPGTRHMDLVVIQDCRGCCASEGSVGAVEYEAEDGFISRVVYIVGLSGVVVMYGFFLSRNRPAAHCAQGAAESGCNRTGIHGFASVPGLDVRRRGLRTWLRCQSGGATRGRRGKATLRRSREDERAPDLLRDPTQLFWTLPLQSLRSLLEDEVHPSIGLNTTVMMTTGGWWSIDEGYSDIDVPALHVTGWYDAFARGTVSNFAAYAEVQKPAKLAHGRSSSSGLDPCRGGRLFLAAPAKTQAPGVVDDWHPRRFDQAKYLLDRLRDLAGDNQLIGDVRGRAARRPRTRSRNKKKTKRPIDQRFAATRRSHELARSHGTHDLSWALVAMESSGISSSSRHR